MALENAVNAIRALLKTIDVAQDMKTALAIGSVLDEVLRQGEELLDIVDHELTGLDRHKHATLFAAAPLLRRKLARLSEERCRRSVI